MRTGVLARVVDQRDHLRRLVPVGRLPALVERRVDRCWESEPYRLGQEAQMRYLLEHTERAPEVPQLARRFAEHSMLRTYLRWHPELVSNQPVRDIERLTTRRDPARSVILNFMHHNHYEGLFTSLKRAGADLTILASPDVLGPETAAGLKQHIRVVGLENPMIPATGGIDHIASQVRPGTTMAIASDVPGHTEVTFLGRRVRASAGAAVIATKTNSLVVVATAHRGEDGESYIQVHEPIEPSDHDGPLDLLRRILGVHEKAVLAWPEVLEMPRARWGIIEE